MQSILYPEIMYKYYNNYREDIYFMYLLGKLSNKRHNMQHVKSLFLIFAKIIIHEIYIIAFKDENVIRR